MANSFSITFHPVLVARAFSQLYPDLPQAGFLYLQIVNKLNPAGRLKLGEMAEQLIRQEQLVPSLSSAQMLSRVRTAVSAAGRSRSLNFPIGMGGDTAIMIAAFVVMMTAMNQTDQDLKEQMQAVLALTAAKEAIRSLLNQVQNLQASLSGRAYSSVGYSAAVAGIPWFPRRRL